MAVLTSSFLPISLPTPSLHCKLQAAVSSRSHRRACPAAVSAQLCTHETFKIDKSALNISEAVSEDELWATSLLRVRSFYNFKPSVGIEDHKRNLAEREFEALKERVAGTRAGFKRVSCINATLPSSKISGFPDDLCTACKGIGADFARAYLSNVCVAKECHRNGLAFALIEKSKLVAEDWGISDLYVHVAVDNEPARNLYVKSGFVYENDEPAWQARFLDRPRRILLWTGLPHNYDW